MRAHTPQGQGDGGSAGNNGPRRTSLGASRLRASFNGNAPRPQTSLRESRVSLPSNQTSKIPQSKLLTAHLHNLQMRSLRGTSQSGYDIITGEGPGAQPARPSSRQGAGHENPYAQSQRATSRESSKENMAPPDAEEYETQRRRIEELKAEVGTLKYTISNYEQEKEMARLQQESEVRDARRRAEEDFKKKQAAEGDKAAAERQLEALQQEIESLRSDRDAKQKELERKVREAEDEARLLQEQLEDLNAAKEDAARMTDRKIADLQAQVSSAQRTVQEVEQESQARGSALQKVQEQLAEKDATIGNLEADVLRLKAQTGDAATMDVIRRELTDQVNHIRALEATNREQLAELKHLRQVHKATEVVEEEKRTLQRKLAAAEDLEKELAEERLQRQRLEDEKRAWAAYLRSVAGDSEQAEFDSPEAVAKALVEERLNSASLTERLGALEPEISQKDSQLRMLEDEKKSLATQVEKLKASGGDSGNGSTPVGGADKARMRLERQRALAVKEVEYLRAQLKTFDAEDITFQPDNFDQKKAERIQELEDLVDKYKVEVQTLHSELSSAESSSSSPAVGAGLKRSHPDGEENEQLGQLTRKLRKLQDEVTKTNKAHRLLETELSVAKEQLAAAKESAKTRILSLRSNPTSDFEAVKLSTLNALKEENAQLLAHVQRDSSSFPTIPMSVLAAAQREIADAKAETASAHKTARRLKEVWASKSGEFKEAVFSTLGWHVTFIPNGKMRVESIYNPSATDEHENSIVFDGERGTMKVSGGPRSPFAQRISDQIGFWVREKGCIPGFLAALTLEFYEEHTRAQQV
ncbi:uncharacterized protein E0L32_000308 [Thyridium curvatum]|uniref:Spindle assembly checkpoint component MAD1 n=1 Tax=Thyridium curvatum TaxID=1093900 RepID=A0A507BBF8_9PEZI|nr:uncharacterized protein E0L32_000308 [Thyridium curvatum]TPX15974.1 hypothetical protein E0L32_000308 [Thyridium curvatum]